MRIVLVIFLIISSTVSYAQSCTCNATGTGSSSFNASTITWTAGGGATCPPASTFTGDVIITVGVSDIFTWDYALDMTGDMTISMANAAEIIFDSDINVTGNIPLTNSGNSTLTLTSGNTLHVIAGVNGDMGDPTNNNVLFVIDGDLIVDGTLSGKNGNGFDGSGTVTAGALDFKGEPECSADGDCPTISSTTCEPDPSTFCTAALPIDLQYFGAKATGNFEVELKWITASEKNNDYFTLERSADGIEFEELTRITGAGNSYSALEYNFLDRNPFQGISYYRLKQTDFDGTEETFNSVAVQSGYSMDVIIVQKAGSQNEILVLNNFDKENQMFLYDISGKFIASHFLELGKNTIDINKSNPGIYIARIVDAFGNLVNTQKLLLK